MRKFARKTREYMRAYARVHGLFGMTSEAEKLAGHAAVDKFVGKARSHRNIYDLERGRLVRLETERAALASPP